MASSILASGQAMGQTAPQEPAEQEASVDPIIVEGFRAVVRGSIDTKRQSSTIVDAISTEDIGNLPALSLSEVLETITGAGPHRGKGGGSEIAIRGLGPFLGATTFNGRQATNGSGDRSVNFSQFPSELVNDIIIYKSQQADLVEGGVAGLIEIGTVKPLDYGKQRLQVEVKGSYNPYADRMENGKALGWRGTASYLDQFDAGELGQIGLSIGVQRNEVTNPQDRLFGSSNWTACDATVQPVLDASRGRWSRCTDNPVVPGGANSGSPFYLVPNSFGIRQQGEEDVRTAVFSALQWQPSDRWDINFDVQYSTRSFTEDRHDLIIADARRIGGDIVAAENGSLRYFEGTSQLSSEGQYFHRDEDYLGAGFNAAWDAADRLKLSIDLAYSNTVRKDVNRRSRLRSDSLDIYGNPISIVDEFPRTAGDIPYIWDFRAGEVPSITVDPRFDVTDHSLFSDDLLLLRDEQRREHTIKAARFDVDYQTGGGFLIALKAGARIGEMTYEDYFLRNQFTQGDRDVDRAANEACRIDFPQKNFLTDAKGATITQWATFDTLCLFDAYTGMTDIGLPDESLNTDIRDVTERTYAGYVMADYQMSIGGLPLMGNVGVRVVQTDVTSHGLRSGLTVEPVGDTGNIQLVPTGEFETVTFKHSTFDVLPSINAILELRPDLLLRGSVYRALARPDPSALGAGRSFTINSDDQGFSSVDEAISEVAANGSPALEPLRAWNYDASLEWYPNKDTLISLALYYKKFQGGRIPVVRNETFVLDGVNVTVPVVQAATTNESSGLKGLEFTLAHSFTYLPKPLDGLGIKLSYNYADTDFKSQDVRLGDQLDPLTGEIAEGIIAPAAISGFSKEVLSAQVFYEIGKLDLQAIYKYRSLYYQDFVGGNSQLRYVAPNEVVDFRASYQLTRNVQIRFEALNLTNEPRVDYMPTVGSFRDYQIFGPSYYVGARFKF